MQPESNVRFLLEARLQSVTPDYLIISFQRDFRSHDIYSVNVPRHLLQQLSPIEFIDYVADSCFEQQPAEVIRVERSAVIFAFTYGL